jgi:hypothetical protein
MGSTSSSDGDVSGLHASNGMYPTTDVWVVKLNSKAAIEWQECLGGSDNDVGYSILQDSNGGFVLTGTTNSRDGDVSGYHGGSDVWVVELAPQNGVENPFLGLANFFDIYPNPSTTQVHLQMWGDQPVQRVKFYDLIGRDVTPSYELEGNMATVNVNGLTDGIYIARLTFRYINYTGTFTRPLVVQH